MLEGVGLVFLCLGGLAGGFFVVLLLLLLILGRGWFGTAIVAECLKLLCGILLQARIYELKPTAMS